ncbi:GNAT family N-acetyltransferase [Paenibacillus sp. FSL H8-0034]|uniref:GNAT family N-acetyltransferase n=1 Tax=Paenibacillus sp. FSL H8-0034 TaxID=2954671 RepID=UPI0030FC892E
MSEVTISAMKIEYYDKIAQLWNRNFGKAVSLGFDSRNRIEAYLIRNPEISTVALLNKEIIGTVLCGHDGRRGTLYHVSVDEEYRGEGIAKKMIERSISILKQEGIDTAVLFAHVENENAVKYWNKNGWPSYPNVIYHLKDL